MNLRKRLVISFCLIILIPVILIAASFWGLFSYFGTSMKEIYHVDISDMDYLGNSIQLVGGLTSDIYDELKEAIVENPKQMEDIAYLKKMNSRLVDRNSFLLLRKGNSIIYTGTLDDISKIENALPSYGNPTAGDDAGVYMGSKFGLLVKQLDFVYSDSTQSSLFILTSASGVLPEISTLAITAILTIVMVLFLTSLALTLWLYKGMVNPLQKLKVATKNIKHGNLDFSIESDLDDEIGELCNDFEEMRLRLKTNAEEKLEYDRESRELISNISHDLKTPITAIKGYVEGIMDGVADTPEKMDKYIRTIYNKTNEMTALINELTFYSKIDTNKVPYRFEKLDISRYFEDCVEDLSVNLESENTTLSFKNMLKTDIIVIADTEQLARVINNIISNSVKYIDKPVGHIEIRLKDVGDFVQVEMEDNGKGIARKDIPYIFDRFYRTDASRNSSKGGSGIGLSIVKKIIEDHGGKIWATSKEGEGTVMYFVLRKYQEVEINE